MDVVVEIKNGEYDLLANGVFLVNANETTTLIVRVDQEHIKLIIKFDNTDTDTSTIKKNAKAIDSTTLELVFTNYNNLFGNYTKNLWRIGSFKNRNLFISYAIYGMTEGNLKKIDYSFYLGETIKNG